MNQSFDVSTIVFAALAIFIVWKLRSVLGTRTGDERPPFNPFVRRGAAKPGDPGQERGKVIPLPGAPPVDVKPVDGVDRWKGIVEPGSSAGASLDLIASADPAFSGRGFLDGAKIAYEMIIAAFSKGDRAALSGLLAKDVNDGFVAAIAQREARNETIDHTFVSLDRAAIEHAQLRGGKAQITVVFESHQINATRDAKGALIEGGSEAVGPVIDHWTFARNVSASNPNWTLVATSAE